MAITVISRTDADTFTVSGDQTSIFHAGRRVKMVGGEDRYGTVSSSTFDDPNTSVNLTTGSDDVHVDITGVLYGIISANESISSIPEHTHDGDEGSGGVITDNVTKVGAPANNQLAVWTGDGTLEGDSEILCENGGMFFGLGFTTSTHKIYAFDIKTANTGGLLLSVLAQQRAQPTASSDAINISLAGIAEYNSTFDTTGHGVGVLGWYKVLNAGGSATVAAALGLEGKISVEANQTVTQAVGVESQLSENEGTVTEFIGFHVLSTAGLTNQPVTKYSFKSDMAEGTLYNAGVIQSGVAHVSPLIYLTEQASAGDSTPSYGQIWVKTATPNELWFTDDAGNNFQLGTISAANATELTGGGDTALHDHAGISENTAARHSEDDLTLGSILSTTGYNGITINVTVDDTSAVLGSPLYQASDFHFDRAQANATGTMPCMALAVGSDDGADTTVLLEGQIYNSAWNWSAGPIYVSDTTLGGLTQTIPDTTGDFVQKVGFALSADTMYFKPDSTVIEIA